MRFSEARLSYLAHQIVTTLKGEGLVRIENERLVLARIKQALAEDYERDARIDAIVRRKIDSLSRNVPPGSREWDILYQKYHDEESRKQKS
jgi:uncharacterized protein